MLVEVVPLIHVVNGQGVRGGRLGDKHRKQRILLMMEGVGSSDEYTSLENVDSDVSSRPL